MRIKKYFGLLMIVTLLISGCVKEEEPDSEPNDEFQTYMDDLLLDMIDPTDFSINFNFIDPEAFGIEIEPYVLGFTDAQQFSDWIATSKEIIEELNAFSDANLTVQEINDKEALLAYFINQAASEDFYEYIYGDWYLGYSRSLNVQLPAYLEAFTLRTEQDVIGYLNLIETAPQYFQEYTQLEIQRQANDTGYGQSELDEIIALAQQTIAAAASDDYFLIDSFDSRIDELDNLSTEQKNDYKQANRAALQSQWIASYQIIVDDLSAISAPDSVGLAHKNNGAAYYAYAIKDASGIDMDADAILTWLSEFETNAINRIISIQSANPGIDYYESYLSVLTTDGPAQFADGYEVLSAIQSAMSADFPRIDAVNFELRKVDESMSDGSSPAFYFTPQIDYNTEQLQYIYINGDYQNSWYTTYAHEGFPGHMYQFNYFLTQDLHPIRYLLTNTGNAEGWATYAEIYALKYALEDDALMEYIQYMNILNATVLIEMDIQIHHLGWDFERFYTEYSHIALEDARYYYDYIIHTPAVTLTYNLTSLYIYQLREWYSTMSDYTFHQVILDAGSTSLEVVEQHLEKFAD